MSGKEPCSQSPFSASTWKEITKDGYSYSVLDSVKKYSKAKAEDEDASIFGKANEEVVYIGKGEKELDGKNYTVYTFGTKEKGSTAEIANDDKFVFYVGDGKIVALGSEDEVQKIDSISSSAPAGTFDIPSDYEEVSSEDLSNLLFSGE